MARHQNTAPYPGKGQKDMADRVASLATLGVVVADRNPVYPHMPLRSAVTAAERRLGLTWISGESSDVLRRGHARRTDGGWTQVTVYEAGEFRQAD